jgi:hypothetical protein
MAARSKRKRSRSPATRLIPGAEDRERSTAIIPIVEAGRETRFQPGQSGNPSGRTSYSALTSAYKAQLDRQLDRETAMALGIPLDSTIAEGIAVILARNALCGDTRAAQELADRTEGKPPAFLAVAAQIPQPKQEITIRVLENPPLPKPEGTGELFDGLLNLVRTSNNAEVMTMAAALARYLRKHGNKRPS